MIRSALLPPDRTDRFWARVDKSGVCWAWKGAPDSKGYGRFNLGTPEGHGTLAHRVAWTAMRGPIPDGLHVDHVCRNRMCVRPSHLELVTPGENTRRGNTGIVSTRRQRAKTQCPHGHPYDAENTKVTKAGRRCCRTCANANVRAWRQRQVAVS